MSCIEWSEEKGKGAKLIQHWMMECINHKTYWLHLDNHYLGLPVFNLEHLHKYVIISPEQFRKRNLMPDTCTIHSSEEYEVEKIIVHK